MKPAFDTYGCLQGGQLLTRQKSCDGYCGLARAQWYDFDIATAALAFLCGVTVSLLAYSRIPGFLERFSSCRLSTA